MTNPELGTDDAQLIARSIDDPAAFAQVFDRHFDIIHRYLRGRVGHAAEDLAAETLLIAFRQRSTYHKASVSARPWLFGIATNLVRRHRRQERRELRALTRQRRLISPPADQEQRLVGELLVSDLGRAIAALSGDQREVLLLYALGELTYEEISEALGLPLGTVRSRLSRARARVRELLLAERAT